jgi:preprotein translocase subunit SecD
VPATTIPESEETASSGAGVGVVARGRSVTPAATPDSTVPESTVPGTSVPAPDEVPPTTEAPVFGPPAPTTTLPPDTTGQITASNVDGTEICVLGPQAGTGEVFVRKSATVDIDLETGGWIVSSDLSGEGQLAWNAIAQQCFNGAPTCPAARVADRLAIVLDGTIQSAPTVNAAVVPGGRHDLR